MRDDIYDLLSRVHCNHVSVFHRLPCEIYGDCDLKSQIGHISHDSDAVGLMERRLVITHLSVWQTDWQTDWCLTLGQHGIAR